MDLHWLSLVSDLFEEQVCYETFQQVLSYDVTEKKQRLRK
jgi:hypothetical protein